MKDELDESDKGCVFAIYEPCPNEYKTKKNVFYIRE